jgi:hypothetical protein
MLDSNIGGLSLVQLDTEAGGSSDVATSTGGRVSISNDVTALFHEAVIESSAYYLLGFQPFEGHPGERKLRVRVRRDGLTVRAPDRYIVGDAAKPVKPLPAAVQAVTRVSDAADIPLRVGALFLDASQKGPITTTLAVELDGSKGETGERQFNLLIEARPLGKGEAVRDSAELSVPADRRRDARDSPGAGRVAGADRRPRFSDWEDRVGVPHVRGSRKHGPPSFVADSHGRARVVAGTEAEAATRPTISGRRRSVLPIPGFRRVG